MARTRARDVLRPSLLDRLMGPREAHRQQVGIGFRELRDAVSRDLEWLLNTRVLVLDEWRELAEARSSLLTYGVPDFSTASWTSGEDRRGVALSIEHAIKTFEPRLIPRTVRVDVMQHVQEDETRLRFRITAELYVEPVREHVTFDTDMDVEGGGFEVTGAF